jgi:hypothetical protein
LDSLLPAPTGRHNLRRLPEKKGPSQTLISRTNGAYDFECERHTAALALAAMRFALIAALMTMVSFSGFANSLISGGYWESVRLLAQSTCKLFHIPLALSGLEIEFPRSSFGNSHRRIREAMLRDQ